ncbi:hypothetical protein [Evansella cellulosilytica]|uniref:Uncharacterized protein n=1 Tax=Evansella cellulosilytica (strain ATCC 21833 / DSM 2522 / FERM P-1141 / JCM 9156 / N-4) TaxID=649639 RepID=E6TVF3_EVAC2|nr:hypothetical protein [Evansella cellulosilytica]ADU30970.1 hypothetical protein Bcell_2715 [Evansella cellulosilytica DSM 2522]
MEKKFETTNIRTGFDQEKFDDMFNNLIDYLNTNNNLQTIEQITTNYLSSNSDLVVANFIDYQVHGFELLGEHMKTFQEYVSKRIVPNYNGKHREVFRRIEMLKRASSYHFMQMDKVLNSPNGIKGSVFGFPESSPFEFSMTLVKNNNTIFHAALNFNDGMALASTLIDNLIFKFDKGANNINVDEYDKLKKDFDRFHSLMENFLYKEEERSKK